jgi:hypothetical protein
VSHTSLFACDLFCALSRGLIYISNANPACSCVYIYKFQFRPIHPPLGDYQLAPILDTIDVVVTCFEPLKQTTPKFLFFKPRRSPLLLAGKGGGMGTSYLKGGPTSGALEILNTTCRAAVDA